MSDVDESAREAQEFLKTMAETLGRLRRMEVPGEVTDASPAGLARKVDEIVTCLQRLKESLPPSGESPEDTFDLEDMFRALDDRVRPLANVTGGPGVKVDSGPGGIVIGLEAKEVQSEDEQPLGVAFAVKVTRNGGGAGSNVATCTLAYDVTDLADNALSAAPIQPVQARLPNCEYAVPAAGSYGLACWNGNTLVLLHAYQEIPLTDTCE